MELSQLAPFMKVKIFLAIQPGLCVLNFAWFSVP